MYTNIKFDRRGWIFSFDSFLSAFILDVDILKTTLKRLSLDREQYLFFRNFAGENVCSQLVLPRVVIVTRSKKKNVFSKRISETLYRRKQHASLKTSRNIRRSAVQTQEPRATSVGGLTRPDATDLCVSGNLRIFGATSTDARARSNVVASSTRRCVARRGRSRAFRRRKRWRRRQLLLLLLFTARWTRSVSGPGGMPFVGRDSDFKNSHYTPTVAAAAAESSSVALRRHRRITRYVW